MTEHQPNDSRNDLTLEQSFAVRKMQDHCANMRKEDLLAMIEFLQTEMLRNKNIYQKLLGQKWGILPPDDPQD